jgi:NADPH-dependent ferric siderophore reductase
MYLCNIVMHGVRGVSTLYYKQAEIGSEIEVSGPRESREWQWQAWEPAVEGAGMVGER